MMEPDKSTDLGNAVTGEIDISKLSQKPGWKVSANLYKYQHFWYYDFFLKGVLMFQKNFVPKPTDFFLATIPKSGSTWLKALAFAIHTRTRYINGDSDHDSPLLSQLPHRILPLIEFVYSFGVKRDPENPLLTTHVTFHSLPESVLNSSCKIIYLCRDPKDLLVSNFLFSSKFSELLPFQEVYEKFCNGVSNCGPFWDHVLGYWKASLEFPDRVMFLRYEELKNDTCFYVKKMAEHMGCGFSVDEEEQGMVQKIVQLCSFEHLSKLEVNNTASKQLDNTLAPGNKAFFRKGIVGDWKNHLTSEMAKRIDQITLEKFRGSRLHFV